MLLPRQYLSPVICLATALWAYGQGTTDLGLRPEYAQTGWPSLHRDSRNSDFSPFVAPERNGIKWRALEGAAVLPPTVIGPEGNRYITTGQGPGTAHLHAFDRDGNLLWQSAPQNSLDDLDSAAALSAPTVDKDGIVYVGDRNQFWAFRPDGTVKWVSEIPGGGPFASAFFTGDGYVGGVSVNGKVVLYQRKDGSLAVPVFDLPGGPGPAPVPVPPGLWQGGLLDPDLIADAYKLFLGIDFEVTNTPAVHPDTGRIYINGGGLTPETGLMYGLDIVSGKLQIAFQSPMGSGSGTSPTISGDGSKVYVADDNGLLTAFDTTTGEDLWTRPGLQTAASPTVGPDETIYFGGRRLMALRPEDGSVKWSVGFDWLAASMLPTLPPNPPIFLTGRPVGATNSVISASGDRLWVAVVLGYEYQEWATGATLVQPRITALVSLDPSNGWITGLTMLPDTCEGFATIASDGRIYVSQGGFLSSIFYYGWNQTLPPELRVPDPPPGGLIALEPVSFRELAVSGVEWVRSLNSQALAALPAAEVTEALTAVRRGYIQLIATLGSVGEATARSEIRLGASAAAAQRIEKARDQLGLARLALAMPNASLPLAAGAAILISQADAALASALLLLREQ